MAKPTSPYAWSTNAVYDGPGPEEGSPTKVEPTSGRRLEGFEPGGKAAAQNLNAALYDLGQWIGYLDSGDMVGDFSFADDVQIDGDLNVDGTTTLAGDLAIAGDLDVTGNVTATGDVRFLSGRSRLINAASAVVGLPGTPGATFSVGAWTFAAAAYMIFPVEGLDAGDEIIAWTVYLQKGSNASTTIAGELIEQDSATGSQTPLGTLASNAANAPGAVTIGNTGLSVTVTGGKSYFVRIASSTGSASDSFTDCRVGWARP